MKKPNLITLVENHIQLTLVENSMETRTVKIGCKNKSNKISWRNKLVHIKHIYLTITTTQSNNRIVLIENICNTAIRSKNASHNFRVFTLLISVNRLTHDMLRTWTMKIECYTATAHQEIILFTHLFSLMNR